MSPRPRMDSVRRPQLLAAASEVLREKGFADTRISDVAQRAGVSVPNVLYYFDSKDALLEEALRTNVDEFYSAVLPELERLASPRERLSRFIEVLASVAHPGGVDDWTLWLESWARALHSPALRAAANSDVRRLRELLESIVRDGQAAGDFDPNVKPEDFALQLIAIVDGFGVSVRLGLEGVSSQRAIALLRGFASVELACQLQPSGSKRTRRKRTAAD